MEKSINSKPTHKQLMIQKQKLVKFTGKCFSSETDIQIWSAASDTQKTSAPLLLALTEQFISDYIIKFMNKTTVSF